MSKSLTNERVKRLVATEVMHYRMHHYTKGQPGYFMLVDKHGNPVHNVYPDNERTTEDKAWADCPNFPEEIGASWMVVEKMATLSVSPDDKDCAVGFAFGKWWGDAGLWFRIAEDAAHRICLAALKAKGVEVPD